MASNLDYFSAQNDDDKVMGACCRCQYFSRNIPSDKCPIIAGKK